MRVHCSHIPFPVTPISVKPPYCKLPELGSAVLQSRISKKPSHLREGVDNIHTINNIDNIDNIDNIYIII